MAGVGNAFSCAAMQLQGVVGKGCGGSPVESFWVLCKAPADNKQEQPWFLLSSPSPVRHSFSWSQRGSCQEWDELQRSQVATGFNGGAAFPQTGCVFERFSPAASVALQHLGTIATNYLTTTHCTPSVRQPLHMDGGPTSHLSRGTHRRRRSAKQQDKLNQKHSSGTQGENAHQL